MIEVVTNQDYLPSLLSLLGKAKKSIDIMSFSFAIGSAGGKHTLAGAPFEVAKKLKEIKEKKGDKIQIRFFTEGLRETVGRNKVTADFLELSGIEVKYGSTHAKGFCIDKRYVLFGSTNLTQQSIMKNNEANLLIDDKKLAKGFLLYFDHLWNGGKHGDVELPDPWLPDGTFKDAIIEMINGAKRKIEFSIYFFNHREIENALIMASQRGVKVEGFIHQHKSFALSYIWANKATVKRMKNAGVEDLYFGPPSKFSHSKYLIVDGKEVALGTGNWLVEDVNIHPQLYIHLKDSATARSLRKHFRWQIKSETSF